MKKIKSVLNFGIGHSIKNFPVVSFDATAGTITNIIGFVNEHEGDINVKLLQNIRSKTIGIWNTATPENPSMVSGAGSYVFKVVEMVQFGAYTKATRTASADLPKTEKQVQINRTGSDIAKTEIEQLDQAIINDPEAFTSYIARSHGESMTALLDAHYIDLAVATAKADKAKREIINADWANLDTATKRENAYRQASRALTGVSRQLTRYSLGSNPEEYATFLHQDVINDLLLAMPKGGDTATGIGRELATQLGATIVAGLGLVKDHVYLGQNIPKGTSFSKDVDFDFSQVFGAMAHKEALFLAINGLTTRATVDPNSGNDILITKFNYFKGAVRPELVRVFRTVASA